MTLRPGEHREILRLHRRGHRLRAIALSFGLMDATVERIIKDATTPKWRPGMFGRAAPVVPLPKRKKPKAAQSYIVSHGTRDHHELDFENDERPAIAEDNAHHRNKTSYLRDLQPRPKSVCAPAADLPPLAEFEEKVLRAMLHGNLTLGPLCKAVGRKSGPVTKAIGRLKRKGYITKVEGRAKVLHVPNGAPVKPIPGTTI